MRVALHHVALHHVARQTRTAEPLDVVHDCSGDGADAALPVVRELP
ncbi:hypothetical protein ACFVYF_08745 [Streptomyces sp. NPDC058274]